MQPERREPGVLLGSSQRPCPRLRGFAGAQERVFGCTSAGSSPGTHRLAQMHPWRLVSVPRRRAHATQLRTGDQARTPAHAIAGGIESWRLWGAAQPSWPGTNLCTGSHHQHPGKRADCGAQGTEPGCERRCGPMAQPQPRLLGTEGDFVSLATASWLCTSPGCHHWLKHVAVMGSCPLGASHRGILWQISFPKVVWLFSERRERQCSPPPPVAPANWFPAGSSDRLPKDGSSKQGTAGGEREGCNTLSILPSAEYCLGETMRPFFKCNLREILAFPMRRPPCCARLPQLVLPRCLRRQRCQGPCCFCPS